MLVIIKLAVYKVDIDYVELASSAAGQMYE